MNHRVRFRVTALAIVATVVALAVSRPAAADVSPIVVNGSVPFQDPITRMPLGPESLATKVGSVQTPAPGVTYRKYTQGYASSSWTIALHLPPNRTDLVTRSSALADGYVTDLREAGYPEATKVTYDPPLPADLQYRPPADLTTFYGVHLGAFTDTASAETRLAEVKRAGITGVVEHEAFREQVSTGPWEVRALVVEPDAAVTIGASHGPELRGADTARVIARHAGALAAVNASEFDIDSPNNPDFNGFDGDPMGIYVQNNNLLSEAVNGRTALLLNGANGPLRITELTTSSTVKAPDGAQWQLDGFHRKPGKIAHCGGVGGDLRPPSTPGGVPGDLPDSGQPWRYETCTDPDEIVVFRPEWGSETPAGPAGSVDVVVDGNWVAKQVRSPAGGPIPAGGRVLQGIGTGAQWLRDHTVLNRAFQPGTQILDPQGQRVTSPTFTAVSGGPALVRGGEVWINAGANGYRSRDGYHTSLFLDRHPRTLAGITAAGQLLLVVIDGRRPGVSVGVTMPEAAAVMKWLGAVDAMMLGIGGDSTLLINDILYNRPTDYWGHEPVTERRVGNAIVLRAK
ncbi:phosphodiester glycosidase family protein [Micromonospora sp. LAH09]|uniref:phosphodiester glycosidase family protein n=1 Tax=Micromonospora cabrerizensis TaxID=2911213 RepID=UPI001EE941EB|nr:phosphodiester glycosidase family protein [Micromonospora cabrerizensis]MCG5468978.1 phosphodiester glycosidase family protein [Micromonospora cabrerizensis]